MGGKNRTTKKVLAKAGRTGGKKKTAVKVANKMSTKKKTPQQQSGRAATQGAAGVKAAKPSFQAKSKSRKDKDAALKKGKGPAKSMKESKKQSKKQGKKRTRDDNTELYADTAPTDATKKKAKQSKKGKEKKAAVVDDDDDLPLPSTEEELNFFDADDDYASFISTSNLSQLAPLDKKARENKKKEAKQMRLENQSVRDKLIAKHTAKFTTPSPLTNTAATSFLDDNDDDDDDDDTVIDGIGGLISDSDDDNGDALESKYEHYRRAAVAGHTANGGSDPKESKQRRPTSTELNEDLSDDDDLTSFETIPSTTSKNTTKGGKQQKGQQKKAKQSGSKKH